MPMMPIALGRKVSKLVAQIGEDAARARLGPHEPSADVCVPLQSFSWDTINGPREFIVGEPVPISDPKLRNELLELSLVRLFSDVDAERQAEPIEIADEDLAPLGWVVALKTGCVDGTVNGLFAFAKGDVFCMMQETIRRSLIQQEIVRPATLDEVKNNGR